ncbi:hypothetical protein O181_064460 [Austropuccinia psidii MF-1]|uniref:Uncharacterized protein n=1 Tax=Austropuccinia psidii MF-1 TaxID=1389203 RepID=A0A9Q3EKJ0_9BASI|nr:hypothetical protein [Austropuccinia psidii MF-1]
MMKNTNKSFARTFVINNIHGENAVELELFKELTHKSPESTGKFMKPYKAGDSERFSLRNKVPQNIPHVETSSTQKITKAPKERKLRNMKVRGYLVRYGDQTCEYDWLTEKEILEATKLLRRTRNTTNRNVSKYYSSFGEREWES